MYDNIHDFSTKSNTQNSCVMCFIIVSITVLIIINNIYIN